MSKNIQNNLRYERKWIFKNTNHHDILNKALKSKFLFRLHYPKRWVNSIYFDDNNYTSIKENLAGINNRAKFRLRWYGKNSFVLHNPKLEIKIKKNFLNYKYFSFYTKKQKFLCLHSFLIWLWNLTHQISLQENYIQYHYMVVLVFC